MVFGTFDFLHPGHVHFFQQAKKHGDELVVVIARDSTVEKTKGKKPVFSEADRLQMVQALRVVDKAVLGYEGDAYRVVQEQKPDAICLGYDQTFFVEKIREKLGEFKLAAKIIRLDAYKPEQYKSRLIRKALARAADR
jgi:FAD synthetase